MDEKRRIQAIGGSLFISLPHEWVERCDLRKGTEISMTLDNHGNLMLSTVPGTAEKRQRDIVYHEFIYRDLIREYLEGTETVTVICSDGFTKAQRDVVVRGVENLLNTEIVEESHKRIVIQNFDTTVPSVKVLIRRMYFLTQTMLQDMVNEKSTPDLLNSIEERDHHIGRLYFAIIRHLRGVLRGNIKDAEIIPEDIFTLRLLIERIERIGDEIKEAARERNSTALLQFLSERYEAAMSSFERKDSTAAQTFWRHEKMDKKRLGASIHLQKIYDDIKDMADLVI
ncbi:phosphate uptake regulator PhoU [Candidatus Woesearchaeota archaeon]|nr:phosphate uptake regulator PhoU [Candidatus Woesearchaeota archaeon]